MGDLFADRLEASFKNLWKHEELAAADRRARRAAVRGLRRLPAGDRGGRGPGALATPPHFRPMHYAAAVEAGKHVFLEKPLCVDAPGYRTLLAANEEAKAKKLSVVVGLQRRHQQNYLDGIQRDPRRRGRRDPPHPHLLQHARRRPSGQPKPAGMSEMEYQIRHWGVFCWLCGDHLVEQATPRDRRGQLGHGRPIRCSQRHGRPAGPHRAGQRRHLGPPLLEFEYAGGVRHFCQARQQPGTWGHVSDNVHGTRAC